MNNHLQKDTSDMEKTLSDIKNLLSTGQGLPCRSPHGNLHGL